MAADVSSLVRLMTGADAAADSGKSTAPITRDLLGGSCGRDTQELDLDLQVPCGWEKRLDLKSGRVYLQRCNSTNSSSSSETKHQTPKSTSKFQDLIFPPGPRQQHPLPLLESPSLDLKLDSLSSASPSSSNYQSVCTLDKVKSALARAEKETESRKRSRSLSKSSSSPRHSNSSSSIKDSEFDQEEKSKSSSAPVAAGCPRCLLYVLIPKSEPRCPRCNSDIKLPPTAPAKKPRIDLNISI